MQRFNLIVFLFIGTVLFPWQFELRADPSPLPECFSYIVVGNGWNVDGIPNNNPVGSIDEEYYDSTIRRSIYNAAIYGNAVKMFPLLRSYTGHIPTDYNITELRLLNQFFLRHGINRFTGHGFFWHTFYASQGPLVNQLNSFNTAQVREFIEYHIGALAHLMKRPVYNVNGHQTRALIEKIHPIIEPISPYPPYELRGLAGEANTIGAASGSWVARANTPGENYFNFITRVAKQHFTGVPSLLDDYNIIDHFDGILYSQNSQPHSSKYENKAESAFFHVINSDADGAEGQMDIPVPQNATELQTHVSRFRNTAARYAAHGKTFGLSALSVRTTIQESSSADALRRQGTAYKEIIKACIEAPNCFAVTIWGGADGDWWGEHQWPGRIAMPYSGVWNETLQSYQPKPAEEMIREYLNSQNRKRLCPRNTLR